jgi:hypothetical protein
LNGKITEDYQLIAVGGAARGSELGLDERQRVRWSAVVKSMLGAPTRSADSPKLVVFSFIP